MKLQDNLMKRPDCGRCGRKESAFVYYIDRFICGECVQSCNKIIMEKKQKESNELKETLGFKK